MKGKPLSEKAKRFLREVRNLEREGKPFSYRALCDRLGYGSVTNAWQFRDQLAAKGYIVDGRRLAYVEQPVVTRKGRALLAQSSKGRV